MWIQQLQLKKNGISLHGMDRIKEELSSFNGTSFRNIYLTSSQIFFLGKNGNIYGIYYYII